MEHNKNMTLYTKIFIYTYRNKQQQQQTNKQTNKQTGDDRRAAEYSQNGLGHRYSSGCACSAAQAGADVAL